MRDAVIIGVGMHKFGRYPEKTYVDMAEVAIRNALDDAGVPWKDVQALYSGSALAGPTSANNIAGRMGLSGIPVYNIEAYCASGGVALRLASEAVATGLLDLAVAVGVEKQERGFIPVLNQPQWATMQGLEVMPCTGPALEAQVYMETYGVTREQLAKVAVKDRKNAALTPYSHYATPDITVQEVLDSPVICDPLSMLMMGPPSDGAAAAVVCSRRLVRKYSSKTPIVIAAAVHGSDKFSPLEDVYHELRHRVAYQAYEKAGCGPEDLNFAQLHNPVASMELICSENVGLCGPGEGARIFEEGRTSLGGDIPVCTDGGFLGRGNCPGASTLAYVAESVWQLRGEAGPRQIDNPRMGLICHGGYGHHAVGIILKK